MGRKTYGQGYREGKKAVLILSGGARRKKSWPELPRSQFACILYFHQYEAKVLRRCSHETAATQRPEFSIPEAMHCMLVAEPRTECQAAIDELGGLADLWAETTGDSRVCIAILDGPVDLSHPSLAGSKLRRLDTLAGGIPEGGLATRHGTHVASIIFDRHDGPVKGIAPRCSGLIVPVFRDVVGRSPVPCSQFDLARAINQAVVAGANIINISGGNSPRQVQHTRS